MKKFGFGKKSDGDDASRNALFGSKKSKDGQENPYAQQPSDNPYAQQPANDPYSNAGPPPPRVSPYQQARGNLNNPGRPGPPGPGGPSGGLPSGPGPRSNYGGPPPPYGAQDRGDAGQGFANEKFGAAGGYGSSRYDNGQQSSYAPPSRNAPVRQGGYGGLGDTDAQRDDLFGGAQSRVQQQQQQQQQSRYGAGSGYGASGAPGGAGGAADNGYGGYGEQRELTEEEREDMEVRDVKQQIMQTKQDSLASTQRSLAMMNQAIETGTGSLARLGAQGERLHNTERNLDKAAVYNREAERRTAELKTLNRSMFAVHVGNPFTSKKRATAEEERRAAEYEADKAQREAVRRDVYQSNQRMEQTFKKLNDAQASRSNGNASERSKYQFFDDDEDQDEDNRIEDEIDANLAAMSQGVNTLNLLGRAMNDEVDKQNKHLDTLNSKSEKIDSHLERNKNSLARIR